jgi:hypothetical protein
LDILVIEKLPLKFNDHRRGRFLDRPFCAASARQAGQLSLASLTNV